VALLKANIEAAQLKAFKAHAIKYGLTLTLMREVYGFLCAYTWMHACLY